MYVTYANTFAEKMLFFFTFAKATHIFFFSKNICELDFVLTRTVNILTLTSLLSLQCFEQLGPDIMISEIVLDDLLCSSKP